MKDEVILKTVNLKNIQDGKARKYRRESSDVVHVGDQMFKFIVTTGSGEQKNLVVSSVVEPHKSLYEELIEVNVKQEFYIGKKGDEFIIKKIVPKSAGGKGDPLPWEGEHKAKSPELVFGKHNRNGFENESEKNTKKENKKPKISKNKKEKLKEIKDDIEKSSSKEACQAAVVADNMGKLLESDVSEDVYMCCPHCSELIKTKIKITRSKVTREEVDKKLNRKS